MKPTISAMRTWLLGCPAISEAGGDIRVNYLGADPMQFSIEDSPIDPVLERYINGSLCCKNFILASRMEYTEQAAMQAANSGIFEEIAGWVNRENRARRFPVLAAGRQPTAVAVTSTGYIFASAADSCRMQIQMQLQYFEQKGVEST